MAEGKGPEGDRNAPCIGDAEKEKPASYAVIKGEINAPCCYEKEKHFIDKGKMGDFSKAQAPFQAGKDGAPVKAQMEAQGNQHDIACYMMDLMGEERCLLHARGQGMGNHEPASHDRCKGAEEKHICKERELPVHVPPSPAKGSIPLPVEPGVEKKKKKENNGQRFMAEIPYEAVVQEDKKGNQHPRVHYHSFIHDDLLVRKYLLLILYHEKRRGPGLQMQVADAFLLPGILQWAGRNLHFQEYSGSVPSSFRRSEAEKPYRLNWSAADCLNRGAYQDSSLCLK